MVILNSESSSYEQDVADLKQQYKDYCIRDSNLCRNLRSLGLGEIVIVRIIDTFGLANVAQKILKDNPYDLMEIEGFGFIKADTIARQLGIQSEDPRRQRALIQSVLDTNKNFGNVYLPETILEKECKKQNVHKFKEMLKILEESGAVVVEGNRIYSKKLHIAEIEVAEMLKERV
jgi:exodeoxyribonuclease V alpha subunit